MNALKKINARVKVLQKRFPGKKRKTLQKQAGKEFRDGKLKAKTKRAPKRKAAKRKPAKRRRVGSVKRRVVRKVVRRSTTTATVGRKRRRSKPKKVGSTRRRRVSGSGGNLVPIIGLGILGIIAYNALKPKPAYQYIPTGNAARDNSAQTILQYAAAAGLVANALAALINSLNTKSDSEIQQAAGNLQGGGALPPSWYGSV